MDRGPQEADAHRDQALKRQLRVQGHRAPGDCVSCGRCCFDPRADYLPVFENDLARMSEVARARTRVDADGRRFMKLSGGHCAALAVDLKAGRFECRIYGERPDVCRWLEPGSGPCVDKIASVDPLAPRG